MSLIFPFYGGCFFASLHLYISIAKRPSLTILPNVHMYKAVSSNFRVALVGSFAKKKCGDGNRCSVGVQGEERCCFLSQMDDKS
jgi:hypothetical protein